jgi:hypothetical protein
VFWTEDRRERDHIEYVVVDGRIIINWILKKWDGAGTGWV